jgi:hypothetical protein
MQVSMCVSVFHVLSKESEIFIPPAITAAAKV